MPEVAEEGQEEARSSCLGELSASTPTEIHPQIESLEALLHQVPICYELAEVERKAQKEGELTDQKPFHSSPSSFRA